LAAAAILSAVEAHWGRQVIDLPRHRQVIAK
jgi:hypothetical protein